MVKEKEAQGGNITFIKVGVSCLFAHDSNILIR